MRFSTHGLSLGYESLTTERELRQRLAGLDVSASLLLEDPSAYPAAYYLLRVEQGGSSLAVGVAGQLHGPRPQVHVVDSEHLLIGYGSEVVKLLLPKGEMLWQVELGSLFRELIELPALNQLLVIHEIGALCLTPEGEVLWRFDKALVEHYAIKRESLILRFVDAPGVRLDLRTGEWR